MRGLRSNPTFDRRYAYVMRPLRYAINVTLDGCCDHRLMFADEELHRHAAENLERADALLFGRVTYEMMEAAFRPPALPGARPDWTEPFARTIGAAKKYVVSSTLDRVDWNAELVRGELANAVQQLKRVSGKGLFVGGVKLPLALAELGLIDEYEFVVHPRLAGHGPALFAGLSKPVDLKLVGRLELGSGAVAMRYSRKRSRLRWLHLDENHEREVRTSMPAPRKAAKPKLLSGGNPQIAKADGDAPVQAYIAAMPGWKRDVGRRLDALIVRNVPNVRKAVRWNTPFYGVVGGVEGEGGRGWFLGFHCITKY